MTITNKLNSTRVIGNTLEIHCVETLNKDDGTTQIINNWRTSFAKKEDNTSDLATVKEHCTDDDLVKIKAILSVLEVEESTAESVLK